MAQLHPHPETLPRAAFPLSCSETPAPRLSVEEAADRLDLTGSRFVFFENAETGRGNLLYHRRDGDYGLVIPPE